MQARTAKKVAVRAAVVDAVVALMANARGLAAMAAATLKLAPLSIASPASKAP